jgi:hypothetical protein
MWQNAKDAASSLALIVSNSPQWLYPFHKGHRQEMQVVLLIKAPSQAAPMPAKTLESYKTSWGGGGGCGARLDVLVDVEEVGWIVLSF